MQLRKENVVIIHVDLAPEELVELTKPVTLSKRIEIEHEGYEEIILDIRVKIKEHGEGKG